MLMVGALGCAAALLLMLMRAGPGAAAMRPAAEPASATIEHPATGAADDPRSAAASDDRLDAALRCRVFAYERPPQRRDDPRPFLLTTTTNDATLADARALASALPDGAHIVLDAGGRRVSLKAAELPGCSDQRLRALVQAGGENVTFRVEDAATRQPMPALLVDAALRPMGPIERGEQVLVVDAGFEGQALAADCVPGPFQRFGAQAIAQLRRAAWVRGRVAGVPFARGTLQVRGLPEANHAQFALDVDVAADGAFAIGPVPAGRIFLQFDCEAAWLAKSDREVDLSPGRQDLGILRLEPLHALHVRLVRDGRDFSGDLLVSVTLKDREPVGFPAKEHRIDNGRLVFERCRIDRAAIRAWTQDGWLAEGPAEGVLAETTSESHPLVLTLEAPGSVAVHASTAPFDLPAHSTILVYPTSYYRDRHALLRCREDRAEERIRRCTVPPSGVVRIDGLWPGEVGVALVSADGTVLASETVRVVPAATGSIALRPAVPLAALDIRSPAAGRRFALTGETNGIVARGRTTAQVTRILVPAGRYEVKALTDTAVGQRQRFEVAAGEVYALIFD
jgi:hypothetical protein